MLEAFWWQRYTATAGDGAMSQEQVERVVDDVLLPVVSADRMPVAGADRMSVVTADRMPVVSADRMPATAQA